MRNVILMLVVLVGIVFAPLLVYAQPSMTELNDCYTNMKALSNDIATIVKNSQNVTDTYSALELLHITELCMATINHLKDLLFIVTKIKNDNVLNSVHVHALLILRMELSVNLIDRLVERVNIIISDVKSKAIVSTGNQIKTELRRLQKLLSPVSKK